MMKQVCFYIFFILTYQSFGQIAINEAINTAQIEALLRRVGVEITTVTVNCDQGSYGAFAGNSNIGISNGLLITTGNASEAIGPNDNAFATGGNTGATGSALLETLPGVSNTLDACEIIVEFNSGCADNISFNYVFASDEYFETVTTISDAAGIFIQGPGFVGTENIALLPDNSHLSIDNVNEINNVATFINNGDGNSAPQNTDNTVVQYDGFTNVLNAQANLQPNQNYTLTFVIADYLDGGVDSGMFIEDGNVKDIFSFGTFSNTNGTIIEGCLSGTINIEIDQIISQVTPLQLLISGDAQNGVDFVDATTNTAIQSLINVNPNTTNLQIEVLALQDNVSEANETIIFEILDTCGNTIDSLNIMITESLELTTNTSDTLTCNGIPIQLEVSGSNTYTWQPEEGLSCTNCPDPMANPIVSTQYIVSSSIDGNCETQDTVNVEVIQNDVNGGLDKAICDIQETVTIGPDTVIPNLNYQWLDVAGNFISSTPNLTIGSFELSTYGNGTEALFILESSTSTGCNSSDEITVVLDGTPDIQISSDKDTIFLGEVVQLTASGAGNEGSYLWGNTDVINNETGSFTFAFPKENTHFNVTGTTPNGCFASASKLIYVLPRPDVFIPSAFSPNDDGVNDVLSLKWVDVEALEIFQIFNRYGELMYTATDLNNPFWNGNFNGNKQEVGVYTYYLVADGINLDQKIIKRGNVTLVK